MPGPDSLSASLEHYLEAIHEVVQARPAARPKDIGARMGVGSSSVTGALHALSERGLIHYTPYDLITLTPTGREVAARIRRRHDILRHFLVTVLSIEPEAAERAACQMEHAIPAEVLERLLDFAQFAAVCPRGGAVWRPGTGFRCTPMQRTNPCLRCALDDPLAADLPPPGETKP